MRTTKLALILLTALTPALIACGGEDGKGGIQTEAKYPTGSDASRDGGVGSIYEDAPSIFGEDGLVFGGKKEEGEGSGIEVNSFLWRASLDTVSFMPLASADPFGGVILTDWYSPEGTENERYKLNVFIVSRQLRSDGIQVRVFKQELVKGGWRDVKPAAETARQLEDTILTRARQLRVAQIEQ